LNLSIKEGGVLEKFYYHDVFSDGRFVFDPRASSLPIPLVDWTNMILSMNPGARFQ